jgi:hypothetical protein
MGRSAGTVIGALAVAVVVFPLVVDFTDVGEETRTETFQEVTELVFDLENSPVSHIGGGSDTPLSTWR